MWQKIKCLLGLKPKAYLVCYLAYDLGTDVLRAHDTITEADKIDEDELRYLRATLEMKNDVRNIVFTNIIRIDGVSKK
jgi:hypothetical protein